MTISQSEIKNETAQRVFDIADTDGVAKFDEIESVDLVKMLFHIESPTPDAVSITKGILDTVDNNARSSMQMSLTNQELFGVIWRFMTSHKFMIELSKIPQYDGTQLCLTLISLTTINNVETLVVRELVRFNKNGVEYTDRRMRSVDYSPESIKMLLNNGQSVANEQIDNTESVNEETSEQKNPYANMSMADVAKCDPNMAYLFSVHDKLDVWYAEKNTPEERKQMLMDVNAKIMAIDEITRTYIFQTNFPDIAREMAEKFADLLNRVNDDLRYQKKDPPKPIEPPKEEIKYHAVVEVHGDVSKEAARLISDTISKQVNDDLDGNNNSIEGVKVDPEVVAELQKIDTYGRFEITEFKFDTRDTLEKSVKDYVVLVDVKPIKRTLRDVVITSDTLMDDVTINNAKVLALNEVMRLLQANDGKVIVDDLFRLKIEQMFDGHMTLDRYEEIETENEFHDTLIKCHVSLKTVEQKEETSSKEDEEPPYKIIVYTLSIQDPNRRPSDADIVNAVSRLIDSGCDNPVMVCNSLENEFPFKFNATVSENPRPVWTVSVTLLEEAKETSKESEEEMDIPTFVISDDIVSQMNEEAVEAIRTAAVNIFANVGDKSISALCVAIEEASGVKGLALFSQEDGSYYIDFDDTGAEDAAPETPTVPTVDITDINNQLKLLKGLFGTTDPSAMHIETYIRKQLTEEQDQVFLATDGSIPSIYTAVWSEKPWDLTVSIVKMMNGKYYRLWVAKTNLGLKEHDWITTKDLPDRWVQLGRDIQNVAMRGDRSNDRRGGYRRR